MSRLIDLVNIQAYCDPTTAAANGNKCGRPSQSHMFDGKTIAPLVDIDTEISKWHFNQTQQGRLGQRMRSEMSAELSSQIMNHSANNLMSPSHWYVEKQDNKIIGVANYEVGTHALYINTLLVRPDKARTDLLSTMSAKFKDLADKSGVKLIKYGNLVQQEMPMHATADLLDQYLSSLGSSENAFQFEDESDSVLASKASINARSAEKSGFSIDAGSRRSYVEMLARQHGYSIRDVHNHFRDDGRTITYQRDKHNVCVTYDTNDRVDSVTAMGGYDQNQPRDPKGQWTDAGGGAPQKFVIPEGVSADHMKSQTEDPSWENTKHVPWRFRSYGAVIVNGEGKFLMRSPKNYFGGYVWTFAKGKMNDEHEHPVDVAEREALEETGIRGNFVGSVPGTFFGQTSSSNYYLMRAKTWDKNAMDKETWSLRWASYEEAKKLILQTKTPTGRARDLHILHTAQEMIRNMQPKQMHGSAMFAGTKLKEMTNWNKKLSEFLAKKKSIHAGGPPAFDPKTGAQGPGSGNYEHKKHTDLQNVIHEHLSKEGWTHIGPSSTGNPTYQKDKQKIWVNQNGSWATKLTPKSDYIKGKNLGELQKHLEGTPKVEAPKKEFIAPAGSSAYQARIHETLAKDGWQFSHFDGKSTMIYSKSEHTIKVTPQGNVFHLTPEGSSMQNANISADLPAKLSEINNDIANETAKKIAPGLVETKTEPDATPQQLSGHKLLIDNGWEKLGLTTLPNKQNTAEYIKGNESIVMNPDGTISHQEGDELPDTFSSVGHLLKYQKMISEQNAPTDPLPAGMTPKQLAAHEILIDKGWAFASKPVATTGETRYMKVSELNDPDMKPGDKELIRIDKNGDFKHWTAKDVKEVGSFDSLESHLTGASMPVVEKTTPGMGKSYPSNVDPTKIAGPAPIPPITQPTEGPKDLDTTTAAKLSVSQLELHKPAIEGKWKFLKYGDSTKLTKYEHESGTHTLGIQPNGAWTIRDKATQDTVASGSKLQDFNKAFEGVKALDKLSTQQKMSGKYLSTNGWNYDGMKPDGTESTYTKGINKIVLHQNGDWVKYGAKDKVVGGGDSIDDLQKHFTMHHLEEVHETVASQPQEYAHQALTSSAHTYMPGFSGKNVNPWTYAYADDNGARVYNNDKYGTIIVQKDGSWVHTDKNGKTDSSEDVFDLTDHVQTLHVKSLGKGGPPTVIQKSAPAPAPVAATPTFEKPKTVMIDPASYKHLSTTQREMHAQAIKDGWTFLGATGPSTMKQGTDTVMNYISGSGQTILKIQDNGFWTRISQDGSKGTGTKGEFEKGIEYGSGLTYKKASVIADTFIKLNAKSTQTVGELFSGVKPGLAKKILNRLQAHGEIGGWKIDVNGKGQNAVVKFAYTATATSAPIDLPVEIYHTESTEALKDPRLQKIHDALMVGSKLHTIKDSTGGISQLEGYYNQIKGGSSGSQHVQELYSKWMQSGKATEGMKLMINGIASSPVYTEPLRRNISVNTGEYNNWMGTMIHRYKTGKPWEMTVQEFSTKNAFASHPIHIQTTGPTHILDFHKIDSYGDENGVLVAGTFKVKKIVKDFDGWKAAPGQMFIEVEQIGTHHT